MDITRAHAFVADPSTPGDTLDQIAGEYPDVHPQIASHPNASAQFLSWAADYGTPEVQQAVADRSGSATGVTTGITAGVAKTGVLSGVAAKVAVGTAVVVAVSAVVIVPKVLPPSPAAAPSPIAVTASSATPSGATPSGATPSAQGSSSAATPSATPVVDAPLDVSRYKLVRFASPSGAITCSMNSSYDVWCFFPPGMNMAGVHAEAGDPNDPVSITLRGSTMTYEAMTGIMPDCEAHADQAWFKNTGWPKGPAKDMYFDANGKLYPNSTGSNPTRRIATAILPYGKSIKRGPYVCTSATTGMTCKNTTTGRGFSLAKEGVKRF